MDLQVCHRLRYQYADAVRLMPTTLRMRPRDDYRQRLIDFDLHVEPEPVARDQCIDLDGNVVDRLWFDGQHKQLSITAWSHVKTLVDNPYGWMLPPAQLISLPMQYSPEETYAAEPYRRRDVIDPSVNALAAEAMAGIDGQAHHFISALMRLIANRCKRIRRDHGGPQTPGETLRSGEGACRDTAMLFIDACRSVGLAARFVSGYHFVADGIADEPHDFDHDLHAWAEVLMPTAGWRGYDPSIGLALADRHVVVAAAADPGQASVLSGTYAGEPTQTQLRFDVSIQAA